MNSASSSGFKEQPRYQKRSGVAPAALLIGVPLASAILYVVHQGFLPIEIRALAQRYLHHPVECAEVVMFCCAISAFAAKLWSYRYERAALHCEALPAWDGQPVPVEESSRLLAYLHELPIQLRNTYLVCRIAAVLDFLRSRGSADDLDDQLRTLTDNDALALEGSYSLTRFITWAIPILGFLGTVLGITGAISGVTPDQLEKNLSTVTDGLALAFDATALGLALTMITMFISFLVERGEQSVLEDVDRFVDRELSHRFERFGMEGGEFAAAVRQNSQVLLKAMEQLVQKQADVWARTLQHLEQGRGEAEVHMQQRLTSALETALDRTLETHSRRLAGLEKQTVEQGAGLLEKMTHSQKQAVDQGAGLVEKMAHFQKQAVDQGAGLVDKMAQFQKQTVDQGAGLVDKMAFFQKQAVDQGAGLVDKITSFAGAIRDTGREQQAALTPLVRQLASQAETLTRLQESEKQLVVSQDALNKNLATLVGALQGMEFRIAASDFRLRLETPESRVDASKPRTGKAA